ncbi:HesB/IscA family protein [Candidatus Thioglobus sp.]|uniref:HesB/IscA family protein n=1 Tax=Candidatus Thioglobus sp. TaxID=2026721 RepID=UPI003D0F4D4A
MITITKKAAAEISLSTHNPETQGLTIRFAVEKTDQGFQYLMGFDDRNDNDIHLESNGLEYILAYDQKALLEGMVVDFDQLKADEDYSFVFMNPNDPDYKPPEEGHAPQG